MKYLSVSRTCIFCLLVVVDLLTLTDKDVVDIINWGIKHDFEYIATSFVRKADDVQFIHKLLGDRDGHIKIYCKIEN